MNRVEVFTATTPGVRVRGLLLAWADGVVAPDRCTREADGDAHVVVASRASSTELREPGVRSRPVRLEESHPRNAVCGCVSRVRRPEHGLSAATGQHLLSPGFVAGPADATGPGGALPLRLQRKQRPQLQWEHRRRHRSRRVLLRLVGEFRGWRCGRTRVLIFSVSVLRGRGGTLCARRGSARYTVEGPLGCHGDLPISGWGWQSCL